MDKINVVLQTVLYAVTFINLVLAVYSWKKKEIPGAKIFMILCVATSFYIFGYAMELMSQVLAAANFWGKFKYIGLPFIPAIWVLLAGSVSGKFKGNKKVLLLIIIPILTAVFRFTDKSHHLFYRELSFINNGSFNVIVIEKGPWYYVHYIFFFFCILYSFSIYYDIYKKEKGVYKKQAMVFMIASFMGISSMVINLFGKFLLMLDNGAFMIIFNNILVAYAIFKYNFMNIIPLSRNKVFDWIYDGILVIDLKCNLLDYNKVASTIFPELNRQKIGLPIDNSLKQYKDLIDITEEWVSSLEEIISLKLIDDDKQKRYKFSICAKGTNDIRDYSVRIKALLDKNKVIGITIMLTDITNENQILQKLREAAQTDYLTGIFNRRYFFEAVNCEFSRACRLKETASLIIFDIDHFKMINDTWGHQVGDEVIREVAKVAKENTREKDLVGRYGGEEFIIFLPDTYGKEALQIAERLRQGIEASQLTFSKDLIHITASFGVAELTCNKFNFDDIDDMIKRADEALYKAKRTGRNRIEMDLGQMYGCGKK